MTDKEIVPDPVFECVAVTDVEIVPDEVALLVDVLKMDALLVEVPELVTEGVKERPGDVVKREDTLAIEVEVAELLVEEDAVALDEVDGLTDNDVVGVAELEEDEVMHSLTVPVAVKEAEAVIESVAVGEREIEYEPEGVAVDDRENVIIEEDVTVLLGDVVGVAVVSTPCPTDKSDPNIITRR